LRRAPGPILWPVAIGCQEWLGVQKVFPATVPRVIVQQQHTPLCARLWPTMALPCPPVDDDGLGFCATLDQRPGRGGMAPHLMHAMLTGPAPAEVSAHRPRAARRPGHLRLTVPKHGLPGPAQRTKLLEDASDGVWYLTGGDLCNAIVTRAHNPYGDCPQDRPPLDVGCQGWPGALTHAAHLLCRHRALHPPHSTLMQLPRIIEAIIVDEPGRRQGTYIDAMRPVAVVARPPGGGQGEDGPDTPCTHGRQQWAQAWTLVASRPTPAYVRIDPDALGKPQPAGMLGEGLVPPLALGVGADLRARRLADIDVGIPLEMARGHRGAHGSTPRSGHCG
jgi:hypothetical protein